jgi:hypothetical protein
MKTFIRESDSTFDPATVELLAAAFEHAWARTLASGALLAEGDEMTSARELLAKSIIAAAMAGERDQCRLTEAALLEFSRSSLRTPPHTEPRSPAKRLAG